jgi:hypothetical protein
VKFSEIRLKPTKFLFLPDISPARHSSVSGGINSALCARHLKSYNSVKFDDFWEFFKEKKEPTFVFPPL